MESHPKINGFKTARNNYLWGGALTLAWKELIKQIVHQPIKITSKNQNALQIARNFNRSPFDASMLSQQCYYARAGFGNQTVKKINSEVSKKFPEKTTAKIEENLQPQQIISYAYFFKKMKFVVPFNKADVLFNKVELPGFEAKTPAQKKQIRVHKYVNDENFIIELLTKSAGNHVFLIKKKKQMNPEQAIAEINDLKGQGQPFKSIDLFQMPKVSISQERSINQLKGIHLGNQQFKDQYFAQISEILKLDIDEQGIKVENEGLIKLKRKKIAPKQIPRKFLINKSFWIIMREKQYHPYFLAFIENVNDKNSKQKQK